MIAIKKKSGDARVCFDCSAALFVRGIHVGL